MSFVHTFCLLNDKTKRITFIVRPLPAMRPKVINIISHIAGWLFFFSLVISFIINGPNSHTSWLVIISLPFLAFYLIFIFLFYFNTAVLIPQLYLKKKYVFYILAVLVLFAAVYLLKPFDNLIQLNGPPQKTAPFPGDATNGPPPHEPPPGARGPSNHIDLNSIIVFVAVWSVSTAISVIRQWRLTERRALQAEAERSQAELSFLKAQVNPHFLFNTLNNIYSMAVTKDENTAPSIMMLSNIMRYVTDEVGEDYVPLESELDCMRDYIDLQRMRSGSKMNIVFEVTGQANDQKIAPLLLMAFVENAFKYGVSNHEASNIIIRLAVDDHHIKFFCQNKLFPIRENNARTGIGIPNAKQRLQHLYPEKHFLSISSEQGLFIVDLTLQA